MSFSLPRRSILAAVAALAFATPALAEDPPVIAAAADLKFADRVAKLVEI